MRFPGARSSFSLVLLTLVGMLISLAMATGADAEVPDRPLVGSTSPSLPGEGAGTQLREGDRVIVEAHFEAGAIAALEAVKAGGAKVLNASRLYQTLTLSIAPADLPALAAVPGVAAVTPVLAPSHAAEEGAASPTLCEGGSVISQALGQMNVAGARAAFGARGAGRTIGVISDSLDRATESETGGPVPTKAPEDEATGDLPGPALACDGQRTPVNVLVESPADAEPAPFDEGRAMLQAVHDLAPHAGLAFASDFGGELAFAQDVERLAAPVSAGGAGADVIVDDVEFSSEPFFQEGPASDAIRRVRERGVLFFTATGNGNTLNERLEEIGSWEAPRFRGVDATEEPEACGEAAVAAITEGAEEKGLPGPYEPDCMDFDPGAGIDTGFGITVGPGGTAKINLQWAEPWFGVETDLIAVLVAGPEGGPGEEVLTEAGMFGLPAQPQDYLFWQNESESSVEARLVIARCAGPNCAPAASASADPRLKFTLDGDDIANTEYPQARVAGTEDTVGPTVLGHAGAPAAVSVAAVRYDEPADAPAEPESYSSRGPETLYFGPVEGTTPAAPLANPQFLAKPDLTATDCASTTFFGRLGADGTHHFCGTSEAAPQAAAVAALIEQAAPLATPAQVVEAMESTATPFTLIARPADVGAGLVNAQKAMEAVGAQPVDDPPSAVIGPPPPEEEKAPTPAPPPAPAAGTAPQVKITSGPAALSNLTQPVFEFTSDRPVSFTCQIDGGTPLPCASPFAVPTKLADGGHGFVVTGKDADGRSGTSAVYEFGVDTTAPRARILAHPPKVVKTRRRTVVAAFRLAAGKEPVTFLCQFDREAVRICPAAFHHRFGQGAHTVRVRAKDGLGNVTAKPTVFHFRVKALPQRHSR
jgi:hypothetical protein